MHRSSRQSCSVAARILVGKPHGPHLRHRTSVAQTAAGLDDMYASLHTQLAAVSIAEDGVKQPAFEQSEYLRRREAVLDKLPPGGLMLLPTNREAIMSADVPFAYRAHTDVLYLSGYPDKDCLLLLHRPSTALHATGGSNGGFFAMCVAEVNPTTELWDGEMIGTHGAVTRFGADQANPFVPAAIESLLSEVVRPCTGAIEAAAVTELYFDPGVDQRVTEVVRVAAAAHQLPDESAWKPPDDILQPLRLHKSVEEANLMRRAADAAAAGFEHGMAAAEHRLPERALSARMECAMKLAGADRLSFPPIVAGGDRALTLHYVKNDCRLAAGELVLVDAGAELGGYCSDVSRTWPVSGTYTTGQRKLYDLVLETNVQVIEELRRAAGRETQPATLRSLHSLSVRILTDGLLELGLLQDDTGSSSRAAAVTELVRREAHRRFYPHSVGHYLGMDTHDTHRLGKDLPLESGCVVTVEPGLYVPDAPDIPQEFRGIGIRIEDDVLLAGPDNVPEVLTEAIPKAAVDVELACQRKLSL